VRLGLLVLCTRAERSGCAQFCGQLLASLVETLFALGRLGDAAAVAPCVVGRFMVLVYVRLGV
jgi:hypothetical protein